MKNPFKIVYSLYLIFTLSLLGIFYYSTHHSYKHYRSITGSIPTYNRIELMIDDKNLINLSKNKTIYIDGKKYKISIENVVRNILVRNKKTYHLIEINILLPKTYHLLDVVEVAIYEKEKPLIDIFKSCWKGD